MFMSNHHDRCRLPSSLALLVLAAPLVCSEPSAVTCDFEQNAAHWAYYGGWEFPGATGTMTRTTDQAKSGKHALRLSADFTNGGRYIAMTYTLPTPMDIAGIRLWVKTTDLTSIGLRVVDSTEQTFQYTMALQKTPDWQQVALSELTHPKTSWGGANDKVFHAPAKQMSISIGAGPDRKTTMYVDDVQLQATSGAQAPAKR
jgi:hypothetical protein